MFLRTRQLPGLKVAALAVALAAGVGLPGGWCAEEPAVAVTNSVPLEYHETDNAVVSRSITFTRLDAPFPHEPEVPQGRVVRGILHFGGNDSNDMAFAWHYDTRKLFLDLNRNRDLTDDPGGVFIAPEAIGWQKFTNVLFSFDSPTGRWTARVDLELYDYTNTHGGYLSVRSFWDGQLSLRGQDWQIGLVSDLAMDQAGPILTNLLLRPWAERERPFRVNDVSLGVVPLARSLFFDGHAYQINTSAGGQTNEFQPVLQFVEQSVPLGEVKLTGQFLHRVVWLGSNLTVVLDHPSGTVTMPVGSYNRILARLEQGGTAAWLKNWLVSPVPSVNGQTPTVLDLGGPLTNTITVLRQGKDLILINRLLGVGGREYVLTDRSKPPEFAIFQDGKKIASGTFEYG